MSTGKQSAKTKYFARDWYRVVDRIQHDEFKLVKVDTAENRADFFTKPLKPQRFQYLKSKIMGSAAEQKHFSRGEANAMSYVARVVPPSLHENGRKRGEHDEDEDSYSE